MIYYPQVKLIEQNLELNNPERIQVATFPKILMKKFIELKRSYQTKIVRNLKLVRLKKIRNIRKSICLNTRLKKIHLAGIFAQIFLDSLIFSIK